MFDVNTLTMQQLCEIGFDRGSSDVFMKADARPVMKLNSGVTELHEDIPVIDAKNVKRMIYALMDQRQILIFEEKFEMDLAFEIPGKCRVRTNVYMAKGNPALVCRTIPFKIRSLEELGMPTVLGELTKHKMGLILVTGPTGSGKTTTLAAMLDIVNRERNCHLVTIEDPLEYIHFDKKAYVSQREVGIDTLDFQPALRAALHVDGEGGHRAGAQHGRRDLHDAACGGREQAHHLGERVDAHPIEGHRDRAQHDRRADQVRAAQGRHPVV